MKETNLAESDVRITADVLEPSWETTMSELRELAEAKRPDYATLYLRATSAIDLFIDEIEADPESEGENRDPNLANYLMYYLGIASFGLGQEDDSYLSESLQAFDGLGEEWHGEVADYLAKIHLYLGNHEAAQQQLDIYWSQIQNLIEYGGTNPLAIQHALEHYLVGRAAVAWAISDYAMFHEYFDQYLARVTANENEPADPMLMMFNLYTYLELNGFNIDFMEKLHPWSDFLSHYLGINVDLLLQAEKELGDGNVEVALKAALEFKEAYREYCKRVELDFDEHWSVFSEEGGGDGAWPSQYFMHPGMRSYPHRSTGHWIDDRIRELSLTQN